MWSREVSHVNGNALGRMTRPLHATASRARFDRRLGRSLATAETGGHLAAEIPTGTRPSGKRTPTAVTAARTMSRTTLAAAALLLGGGSLASFAPTAEAVVPGKNGKLAVMRFVGNDRRIFTMAASGKGAKQLTNGTDDEHPRWSPDGTKVLFIRGNDVWVVPATGGDPTNLTNSSASNYRAAWSPDGTKIAFTADGSAWTMDADGSHQTRVTGDDFGAGLGIDWSPDGTKLVLDGLGSNGHGQIWVMDTNGSNRAQLTNTSTNNFDPRWSPDGSRIVWEYNFDIWSMKPDGTDQTNLTNTPDVTAVDDTPTYSPDGKRILFGVNCHLKTMAPTGGKAKPAAKGCLFDPDWQTAPSKSSQQVRDTSHSNSNRGNGQDGGQHRSQNHGRHADGGRHQR